MYIDLLIYSDWTTINTNIIIRFSNKIIIIVLLFLHDTMQLIWLMMFKIR